MVNILFYQKSHNFFWGGDNSSKRDKQERLARLEKWKRREKLASLSPEVPFSLTFDVSLIIVHL
jgi:hypothetical protein